MARKPQKRPPEATEGSYVAYAHSALDSVAYQGCSYSSKALLVELLRQHTGKNNGHLHAVHSYLAKRGFGSKSTLFKSLEELQSRGLIIKTRQGGINTGACRYALTWLAISSYIGLDISASTYRKGSYILLDPPPKIAPSKITCAGSKTVHAPLVSSTETVHANQSTCTETVLVAPSFAPATGSKTVHNECLPILPAIDCGAAVDVDACRWSFAESVSLTRRYAHSPFVKTATVGAITWH